MQERSRRGAGRWRGRACWLEGWKSKERLKMYSRNAKRAVADRGPLALRRCIRFPRLSEKKTGPINTNTHTVRRRVYIRRSVYKIMSATGKQFTSGLCWYRCNSQAIRVLLISLPRQPKGPFDPSTLQSPRKLSSKRLQTCVSCCPDLKRL